MTIYKKQDSKYYWVNLIHPISHKRIRKSTKTSIKKEAEGFERDLLLSFKTKEHSFESTFTFTQARDRWLKEQEHKKSLRCYIYRFKKITKVLDGTI